jgi:hypothetical protein
MLSPWWTRLMACVTVSGPPVLKRSPRMVKTRLSKHIADLQNFKLGTAGQVVRLIHAVRHNHFIESTRVDPVDSVSAQDSMCDERIHLGSALFLQQLRGSCDGVRCVRQIVNKDRCSFCNVANQHHGGILSVANLSRSAFLCRTISR